jgi:hypothetical protein
LWTVTFGGKVEVEDSRVRTETVKLEERRAVTIGRPILPDAPITRTVLMGDDIFGGVVGGKFEDKIAKVWYGFLRGNGFGELISRQEAC